MKVQVFDTYVKNAKGETMHFDVLIPEGKKLDDALTSAKEWLKTIKEEAATITSEECSYCHTQNGNPEVEKSIKDKGYHILKMDGCP